MNRSISLDEELGRKYDRLCSILRDMGSVITGYSGGVDSTLLVKVAHAVLGDKALAVTARSESLPKRELREAAEMANLIGCRHLVIDTAEVQNPAYAANPANRCYFCKAELFGRLEGLQERLGYRWLAYGENLEDQLDHRPGGMAARDHAVRAPLKEAGLTKSDIRTLAHHLGLPVWDKPAFACLSSRFAYGTSITPAKLAKVEAAEDCLWELGFRQFRVRYHEEVARIEVDRADMLRILELADEITRRYREIGFTYVSLDLLGYRRGSMNEARAAVPVALELEP